MSDQDVVSKGKGEAGGLLAPVLPLRDIVVFPHMIVPLFVGREKSVRALEEVMNEEKQILLLTQKNASDDDPNSDGLHRIGTLATVLQLLKLPDQTVRVLVEGKGRARVTGFVPRNDFFQATTLVVAVQTSAISGPALAKVQKIGSMFEPLLVGEGGVAAIVTYSDQIKVWQDFTHSADDFTRRMRKIEPDGDSRTEARMNDAVLEAVKMFADRPKFRRVLVVIGESRDRGSQAKLEEVVTKAQAANVTIYPVNYSVYKTSFTSRGDERFESSGQRVYNTDPGNLLLIFSEIGRLATQNAGDALANYTGGEKVSFAKLSGLERVIAKVGDDLHTRYLLSFEAGDSQGSRYHAITVHVRHADAIVRARPGYWPE